MKVKELIEELGQLENQDAEVAIEAPFYLAENSRPYRWPVSDFALMVTGVEDEADSPGGSYLLKSWSEDGEVPDYLKDKPDGEPPEVMEAVDSLIEKLQRVKSRHLTVYVRTVMGVQAIVGLEDEATREDVDGISLIAGDRVYPDD